MDTCSQDTGLTFKSRLCLPFMSANIKTMLPMDELRLMSVKEINPWIRGGLLISFITNMVII